MKNNNIFFLNNLITKTKKEYHISMKVSRRSLDNIKFTWKKYYNIDLTDVQARETYIELRLQIDLYLKTHLPNGEYFINKKSIN